MSYSTVDCIHDVKIYKKVKVTVQMTLSHAQIVTTAKDKCTKWRKGDKESADPKKERRGGYGLKTIGQRLGRQEIWIVATNTWNIWCGEDSQSHG